MIEPIHNSELEKACLGSIMIDPWLINYSSRLSQEDFYDPTHYSIYKAMLELNSAWQAIDLITVSGKLKEKNELQWIGGNPYLIELTNTVPTSSHFENYQLELKKLTGLRKLRKVWTLLWWLHLWEDTMERIVDYVWQIDRASELIQGLEGKEEKTIDKIEQTTLYLDELYSWNLEMFSFGKQFSWLDKASGGGLQRGKIYRLWWGSNIWKSWFMYNLWLSLLDSGAKVHFFTLENDVNMTTTNFLAHLKWVNPNLQKIRENKVDFSKEVAYLADRSDKYEITFWEFNIYNIFKRAIKSKADVIFIDYIQLVDIPGSFKSESEKWDKYAQLVQKFAVENNIAVVDLSQLSNSANNSESNSMQATEFKWWGGLKAAADIWIHIFLSKEETLAKENAIANGDFSKVNTNYVKVRLTKNRLWPRIPDIPYMVDFEKGGKFVNLAFN